MKPKKLGDYEVRYASCIFQFSLGNSLVSNNTVSVRVRGAGKEKIEGRMGKNSWMLRKEKKGNI